ncbi:peptidase domain-containing ABC transporter [Photobacterium makurazakiensis]|uniref:peptidase domain-containing ABC transporter n=1 Tax=Photobacterium makurazakiensis TaxID=2910234 RepID=UPI003D104D3B
MNTALEAYVLIARYYHVYHSVHNLKRDHGVKDDTMTRLELCHLINNSGLQAKQLALSWTQFKRLGSGFPVVIQLENNDFVIAAGVKSAQDGSLEVLIQDPRASSLELIAISEDKFRANWKGAVVLVRPMGEELVLEQPFGFTWLFSEVLKQPSLIFQVASISMFLHIIAFVVPLFSMVVFDKVIGYQGYSTLHVLFLGAMTALIVSAILSLVRNILILHTVARLDIEIAHLTCRRLFALPLVFFQKVAAGKLAKQVQEASSIREFITGNLLFTLIELTSVVVILPVMWFFSPQLTWLVIGFAVVIMTSLMCILKPYRKQLEALYIAEADRQSLIVETVRGIETIKSLAIEKRQQQEWLDVTAKVVTRQHTVGRWSGYINEISGFLQKAMTLTIIWFGAQMVLAGELTIGTLIAFNIMAGRIAGPLVQLVGLASKYQQTAISVDMLSRVLNSTPERLRSGGITPPMKGLISTEKLSFSYHPNQPPVLQDLSFEIRQGEKIGIVGPSGSGKSTLTRLILGFYQPSQGYIRVDSHDLREYDPNYLRAHIGVVLQESFLFRGTVKENLAKSRPDKSLEQIIEVAQMSGANEFIDALPQGYDTMLEENASNLSGGQKQRLNFSRALLDDPKILVMDEATSALDAESEQYILDRLNSLSQGRTLINISHRLSSMPQMDRILVLEKGRLVDLAPHSVLLERCQLYKQLWRRQFQGTVSPVKELIG